MFTYTHQLFCPYVYTGAENNITLEQLYEKTRQKWTFLAFINSYNHTPGWSYNLDYSTNYYENQINYIRSKGGDVAISFGGSNGNEIATDSTNLDIIFNNYKKVIDKYHLKYIDLDIEGVTLYNTTANDLRNKALKKLKQLYPYLIIQYTLPVSPDGLHQEALSLLQNAKTNNVPIDIVNLMCMDYGHYYAPQPTNNMGNYAKLCCATVKNQLIQLGLTQTAIGCTVMIGQNDIQEEVFTTYDGNYLLKALSSIPEVKLLSFWCINRDNGNGVGKYTSCNWSSIQQKEYEFTYLFQQFTKYKNLCYDKNAKATSIEKNDLQFDPKYAIDDNVSTRWASEEYKPNQEYLFVDLKQPYYVSEIIINWEYAYATKFAIQYSQDGQKFYTLQEIQNNKKLNNRIKFNPITFKYLKLLCIQKATQYGYSVYELQCFNK